jgi:hypothetical protein
MEPTEAEIVDYAVWFANERVETFNKDMAICLRPDEQNRHAYMPALIACTGMIELFACLMRGDLEARGVPRIVEFANRFMNPEHYSEMALKVLWDVFRHKVAHVSRPYGVKHVAKLNSDGKRGLVTWEVTAFDREPAIQIAEEPGTIPSNRRPAWRSGRYTHKCSIHLPAMARDIRNAISGPDGYIQRVREESELQENFKKCMDQCFDESG